jgi:hypothetical protein
MRELVEGDNPRLVVFVRSDGDLSQMSQWISWDSGMDETTCPQHLARLTRYLDGQLRIYPNAPGTIYPQLQPQSAVSEPESGPMPSPNTRIHSSQLAHCSATPEEIILPDPEDSDHESSTDSNIATSQEEERSSDLGSNSESEDPGKPINHFTLNRFNSVRQRNLSERAEGFMHTYAHQFPPRFRTAIRALCRAWRPYRGEEESLRESLRPLFGNNELLDEFLEIHWSGHSWDAWGDWR